MNKIKQLLTNWDKATDDLARVFVDKYFFKEYVYDDDYYWIGTQDEDREVLAVNDYFFDLDDIVSFIRYNYTKKDLFKFYDYRSDCHAENKTYINIKNWRKLKKNENSKTNFRTISFRR